MSMLRMLCTLGYHFGVFVWTGEYGSQTSLACLQAVVCDSVAILDEWKIWDE